MKEQWHTVALWLLWFGTGFTILTDGQGASSDIGHHAEYDDTAETMPNTSFPDD